MQKIAERQFTIISKAIGETDKPRFTRLLNKSMNDLLFQVNRIAEEYRVELDEPFENIFKDSIETYRTRTTDLIDRQPKELVVHFYKEDFKSKENMNLLL